MRKLIVTIVAVLSILSPLSPVLADDYIAPELVRISTPIYRPSVSMPFEPALGTYTYSVTWQGIPAASATVTIDREGANYHIVAAAKTASAIDLFYTLRYRAEGTLSVLDFSPEKIVTQNQENSTIKNSEVSFLEGGEVFSVRTQKNREPVLLRFNPHNNMLEPFSAVFLARSLDWTLGETKEFDTFNGKSRYLVSLTAVEKTMMEFDGQQREVWAISPKVKNLTSKKDPKKLREARIYVTTDSSRDVLQIVSEVFIGSVKTTLESFVPAATTPSDTRMAMLRKQAVVR